MSPGLLRRGLNPVMFGSQRPTLVKSLRYPPGGARDELAWPDKCLARQERDWGGWGKKVCRRNSARGYSHSIGTWGCLLLASVHPRQYFSFSLFLNAQHWTFHLLSGQDLTSVLPFFFFLIFFSTFLFIFGTERDRA